MWSGTYLPVFCLHLQCKRIILGNSGQLNKKNEIRIKAVGMEFMRQMAKFT
jgi:hypothetical protein